MLKPAILYKDELEKKNGNEDLETEGKDGKEL